VVENDKAQKTFTLHLPKESLLSEEQLLFQASLGIRLSQPEAKSFAAACRTGELRVLDVKGITGLSNKESLAIIDRLLVEVLVEEMIPGNRTHVRLREHLVDKITSLNLADTGESSLVSDQPVRMVNSGSDQAVTNPQTEQIKPQAPLRQLTDTQRQIIRMCDVYRSLADLMNQLGMTHRTFFKRTHVEPLLRGGVLKMRYPEQPNHPHQAYVLSEVGLALSERVEKDADGEDAKE
jgi:ATP-dependent DNA helicase RecG